MNINHTPLRSGLYSILLLSAGIFCSKATATTPRPSPTPIATMSNAIVPWPGKSMTINIGKYFPAPFVPTNASVTFPSNSVYVNTSMGDFMIQLDPTNTPLTTANFLRYVTNGLYNGMTIERAVTNFVIQTGGYYISRSLTYTAIPTFGTIASEAGISNLRGTVAMALSTGSNSATSAWFVNLTDNSALLDGTNDGGPFTVFGQIQGIPGSTNGMDVMDSIESLPTISAGPFADLPLNNWTSNSSLAYTNLVIVTNMVATIPSAVCSVTNPFSIALQGTNLVITPLSQSAGPSTVYINTVDTNGRLLSKTFQISTRKFFQTISFSAPSYNYNYTLYSSNALYSLTNYAPTVASGASNTASGLPITFTVASGPASMTNVVSNGVTNSMIRITGVGWVQLAAHQPGNFCYNAAPAATAWLEVYKNTNPITFPTIPDQTNGFAGPYTLPIAMSNYPTSLSGLPVTLTIKSGPAKALAAKAGLGYAFTITGAGTVTVVATQAGNANYYSALPVTNSFVVTPAL